MEAAGNDPKVAETLRDRFGTLPPDGILDFIEGERNADDPVSGGLGIANIWDIHDLMKVSGFEQDVTAEQRRVKASEISAGGDFVDQALKRRSKIDPLSNMRPVPEPAGAPPGVGDDDTDEAFAGGAASVARFTDEAVQKRVTEIFNHGLALDPAMKSDLQERLVKNLDVLGDLDQMNPSEGTYINALEETRKTLLDAIGTSTTAEAEVLRQAVQQANDPAQLTRITENLSMAAEALRQGGELKQESVASIVAQASQGTREFHQAHGEIVSNTDMTKLEQAITTSIQNGSQDMAEVLSRELGGSIDKLSKTLGKQLNPEEQRKMFEQMANQIQTTMVGPGQKTLRAILHNSLQSLPKTFAKVVGVHTLQPHAMEVEVNSTPPPAPPPPPANNS